MVKKVLLAIALAIPMLVSAQTLKIGIVDVAAIVQAHPETTTAQNKIAEAQKKYEAEYQKLGEEMQRLYEDFQKSENELPAIKERKAREVQEYQNKLQQFEQSAYQDLQRMQADLMQPVIKQIQDAIQTVGKEGGYSLIQDYNQQNIFYYAAPVEDITTAVKTRLGIK